LEKQFDSKVFDWSLCRICSDVCSLYSESKRGNTESKDPGFRRAKKKCLHDPAVRSDTILDPFTIILPVHLRLSFSRGRSSVDYMRIILPLFAVHQSLYSVSFALIPALLFEIYKLASKFFLFAAFTPNGLLQSDQPALRCLCRRDIRSLIF